MPTKFTFASKSGGASHTTTLFEDGRVTCSCRGFSTPNKCWHVREVLAGGSGDAPAAPAVGFISPMPASAPISAFIPPMLASALKEGRSFDDYTSADWVVEQKIDGHRLIVRVADTVTAWSRLGNVRELPIHIQKALDFLPPGTYDGELHVPGGTSTDVTDLTKLASLQLVLFDILSVGPTGCAALEGTARRQLLEVACSKLSGPVSVIQQFDPTAVDLEAIWAAGLEGVVVKRRAAIYQPGKRSADWVKFKRQGAAEVTITGFEAGKLGPYSKITAVDAHGVAVTVKTLNDEWRVTFARQDVYGGVSIDGTIRVAHPAIGRKLVISYQEKTRDGKYRHPMADHLTSGSWIL